MPCLAVSHLDVHYHGKAAHASAYPEEGINAADAITVAQTAIGLLRQHIRHDRPDPRHRHPRRRRPEHRAGRDDVQVVRPGPHPRRAGRPRAAGPALLRGGGAGDRLHHGGRPESPHYSEMTPDRRARRCSYQANAEARGRVFPAELPAEIGRAHRRLDRHGQCLVGHSDHPPMLGLDSSAGGQPSARVRRLLRQRRSPIGRSSTVRWPWPGRRSTPPPRRRCGPACRRPADQRGADRSGGGPQVRASAGTNLAASMVPQPLARS